MREPGWGASGFDPDKLPVLTRYGLSRTKEPPRLNECAICYAATLNEICWLCQKQIEAAGDQPAASQGGN